MNRTEQMKFAAESAAKRDDIFANIAKTEIQSHVVTKHIILRTPVVGFFDDLGEENNGWKTGELFTEIIFNTGQPELRDYYCNWD